MAIGTHAGSVCLSPRKRLVGFAATSSTHLSTPPLLRCDRPLVENNFAAHHRERWEDAFEAFKRGPTTLAPHQARRYRFLILEINEYKICVKPFSYYSFALKIESICRSCAHQVDKTSETNLI